MGVVSDSEFERMLAGLDRAAFGAFVADVWRARGRDVAREEGALVAADGDRTRRIRLVSGRRRLWASLGSDGDGGGDDGGAAVDAVASARDSATARSLADRLDARLFGPSDLRDVLLYGVERDEAERIVARHFETTLSRETPSESNGGEADDSESDPASSVAGVDVGGRARTALLVVALVVVAGVVVAGGGAGPLGASGASDGVAGFNATVTFAQYTQPSVTPEATGEAESTATETADPDADAVTLSYPPGVRSEGVTDPEALADAHEAALRNRSYRVDVFYDGVIGEGGQGPMYRLVEEHVVVESDERYRRTLAGRIGNANGTTLGVDRDVFADGQFRYVRDDGDETAYRRAAVDGERVETFAEWMEQYLVVFLSTSESTATVEEADGDAAWHVSATGEPAHVTGDVADYRAEARVTESGFVTDLSVTFVHGATDDRVQFAFVYSDRGSTAVESPAWYDEAVNATGG